MDQFDVNNNERNYTNDFQFIFDTRSDITKLISYPTSHLRTSYTICFVYYVECVQNLTDTNCIVIPFRYTTAANRKYNNFEMTNFQLNFRKVNSTPTVRLLHFTIN